MATRLYLKIIRETKRVFLNQKEKNQKKNYNLSKNKLFKSEVKEIINILYNLKIKNDRKIEEIKKFSMIQNKTIIGQ